MRFQISFTGLCGEHLRNCGTECCGGKDAGSYSAAFFPLEVCRTHSQRGAAALGRPVSSSRHGSGLVSQGSELLLLSSSCSAVALRLEAGQVPLKGIYTVVHFVKCFSILPKGLFRKHYIHAIISGTGVRGMDGLPHSPQGLPPFGSSLKSSGLSFGERGEERLLKVMLETSTDWYIGQAKAPALQIRLLTNSRKDMFAFFKSMLSKIHIRIIDSKITNECSRMHSISNYVRI